MCLLWYHVTGTYWIPSSTGIIPCLILQQYVFTRKIWIVQIIFNIISSVNNLISTNFMLGFIFKNELLVLTFILNFTMDFFLFREKWESVLEYLSRQDPLMIRTTMARIFKTMDSTGVFFVLDPSTSALWEIPWLAWHKPWQSSKADNRLAIIILYIVYRSLMTKPYNAIATSCWAFFYKQKALPENSEQLRLFKHALF